MRPIPWSQRTLTFGQGPGHLPTLLERLQGTPVRLLNLLRDQPHERLVQRGTSEWSVLEHIGHLLYLDQRMEERLDDFLAKRPHLRAIELDETGDRFAGHRDRALGDLLEEFRLTRHFLLRRLRSLDPIALAHRAVHPCRGIAMDATDMAVYIAEHDDDHLVTMRLLTGKLDD